MKRRKTDPSIEAHKEHFRKLEKFLAEMDLKRGKFDPPTPEEKEAFEAKFRHFVRSGKWPE